MEYFSDTKKFYNLVIGLLFGYTIKIVLLWIQLLEKLKWDFESGR